ncbi:putative RNA polymerase sigma factor [uncultured Mediterranean phage uvMED]|nr:putative RNA polymerase sigma factor [uncultured Mediterranean phage uvMED]
MKLSKIDHELNQYLHVRSNIISILADAAIAERFIRAPSNKRCPSMYQMLETYYDKKDWGYHVEPKLKLRGTPKQMQNYDTAIDLLLMIDTDISEDPVLMRKISWMRANRNKWTVIGKYFGIHRTSVKRMYDKVLDKLSNKIISESVDILIKKFS